MAVLATCKPLERSQVVRLAVSQASEIAPVTLGLGALLAHIRKVRTRQEMGAGLEPHG